MILRIFSSQFSQICIISVSGDCICCISKNCQIVAIISMTSQFHNFFLCNCWRVFVIWNLCVLVFEATKDVLIVIIVGGFSRCRVGCRDYQMEFETSGLCEKFSSCAKIYKLLISMYEIEFQPIHSVEFLLTHHEL